MKLRIFVRVVDALRMFKILNDDFEYFEAITETGKYL